MTVIAYKDGIMAADGAVWASSFKVGNTKKITRLPDGSLFGCGGHTPIIRMAREWLIAGGAAADKPSRALDNFDLDGLVVRPDGVVWHLSSKWDLYYIEETIAAAGSHFDFLMGAMYAGASAEEAVRLAIKYGDSAGGEIQVEHLNQLKPVV